MASVYGTVCSVIVVRNRLLLHVLLLVLWLRQNQVSSRSFYKRLVPSEVRCRAFPALHWSLFIVFIVYGCMEYATEVRTVQYTLILATG
jgi:hypothetical protein